MSQTEERVLAKDEEELSAIVKRLLKLQCVFMFEKEIETLKNRAILREVNDYVQKANVVNFNRILLTIVKSFTEKYYDGVKRELTRIFKRIPALLGGEHLSHGILVLNKCLIVLEKRMFENLYDELNQEPINYLTIFNMFNLDFIKTEERYKVFFDKALNIRLEEGHSDLGLVTVKCINIFALIKYVYYNAIIDAKKVLSQRIFKQFIEENVIKDMRKGRYAVDPCEKHMKRNRQPEEHLESQQNEADKLLNIAEYLIKEMWSNMPDLKNPICLKKETFMGQLSQIVNEQVDDCGAIYEDEEEVEKINWNYQVTRDGETLYLNAPSYKYFAEFHPGLTRFYEHNPTLTEADFDRTFNANTSKVKCHQPDIFDIKMEAILHEGKQLVGDEIGPENRRSKNERIMTYFKMRNKVKKRQLVKNELWNQFQKRYFTFDDEAADDTKDKKCHCPIRPQEFYDLIPRYMHGTVMPITFEFDNFKFICAACGFFINKGKGVEALGYKWHDEHFKCRVCSESFTEASEFILYRGIVICLYDAENMFNLSIKAPDAENLTETNQ